MIILYDDLGSYLGWLGMSWNEDDTYWTQFGYPSDWPYDGQILYVNESSLGAQPWGGSLDGTLQVGSGFTPGGQRRLLGDLLRRLALCQWGQLLLPDRLPHHLWLALFQLPVHIRAGCGQPGPGQRLLGPYLSDMTGGGPAGRRFFFQR